MNPQLPRSTGELVAAAVLIMLAAVANSSDAQSVPDATKLVRAPAPASAKIRALTGNWVNDHVIVGVTHVGVVPLRAEYEQRLKQLETLALAGKEVVSNESQCLPSGPALDMAFGFQALADADELVVLTSGPFVRHIWIDGRAHTADRLLFGSYEGESIGSWDGNTLVIDTVGLKASDEIILGIPVNDEKLHLTERWHLVAPGKLQVQTTLDDTAALLRPWTFIRQYFRRPANDDLMYCTPAIDRTREGGFDLTPPAGGYIPPGAKP
jgi:hypothetical protein